MSNNEYSIATLRKVVKLLVEGKSVAEIFLDTTLGDISLQKIKELELIIKNEQPIVKLDKDGGNASIINYNVPNSTSYKGLNYIILRHSRLNEEIGYEWFKDNLKS